MLDVSTAKNVGMIQTIRFDLVMISTMLLIQGSGLVRLRSETRKVRAQIQTDLTTENVLNYATLCTVYGGQLQPQLKLTASKV